jgi:UDP-2,3-diacylglucosamine hydrolase
VSEAITDVAPAAVADVMARHGVTRLIHGHTHRPAIHSLEVAGRRAQRIVLGDWYDQGSVLRLDGDGLRLDALVPTH